ncbi:porin family protein [Sphingomonas radiodurans]|uniref:porin family protein n=1 Tax=Sphingomonas radiodurans TaxID=2890321 RepID=UPI001E450F6C|nr:porin family protein [Sphingomonas radiodurans]WBH16833.1 porin family protein [Sphingomonas radiodurans]
MLRLRKLLAGACALASALMATPSLAAEGGSCAEGVCQIRLTPAQLLASAERLVAASRFDEAKPLVAALSEAPGYRLQHRFLSGFIAAQKGDHAGAVQFYEAILADDPNQTRVRIELGKAMLALGKPASADRQFKYAAQDDELPADVAQSIRGVRDIIRANKSWRVNVNLGFAPDSNINSATSAETVTVHLGDLALPLTLDPSARAQSGTGQVASLSSSSRIPLATGLSVLTDFDGSGVNYAGKSYDDYQGQIALGGEYAVAQSSRVSLQAIGARRWFGGNLVSRQIGTRVGFQTVVSERTRAGIQLDARRTSALFDRNFDGWQAGIYATYERGIGKAAYVSGGPFLRRDWLRAGAYSNTELGGSAAIGAELPYGITAGASGSVSRAVFDAPAGLFSLAPRDDWRFSTRLSLGNRKLRVLGMSPQITWTTANVRSSVDFYKTARSRMAFEVARFF